AVRLLTFERGGAEQLGAVARDSQLVVALAGASQARDGRPAPGTGSLLELLQAGPAAIENAAELVQWATGPDAAPHVTVSLADVELLAPIPRPPSLRDAMSFETHVVNSFRKGTLRRLAAVDARLERALGARRSLTHLLVRGFYAQPPYYNASTAATVGSDAMVRIPRYCHVFDYELEWAVVIGREGADIAAGQARDHIAGYTIFNDFSARDEQAKAMRSLLGPGKGKDFDTGNALGPWLVTRDEIPQPYELTMTARVNGAEWSRASTADMYWTFEDLIAHVSRSETLRVGDVIASGTAGLGCGLEHGAFLKPGDVVELEVERLGVLRNHVVAS
ncbi:MAG: fumarylacetoacetate hydrolase family protein, partial [Actinomycetota bacterium]|nr:fumarylacetoacetate hydrolase family protein [Actinomycetota bacterium]